LNDRRRQLELLNAVGLAPLAASIQSRDWPQLAELAHRFLQPLPRLLLPVAQRVTMASRLAVPLQPCIRDVWHDHILFTGEQVSGIVDFGAMRVDNVACDVARLAGSLTTNASSQWTTAIAAYETVRPLIGYERELVTAFDQSTVVLGGLNWIRWVYVEQREFADRARVEARLAFLLRRLENMCERT
jgi:homoserine kinase type II